MTKLLSGRRILVVEDETLIVTMLESILADLGCESVSSASSVHQALALIAAEQFDAAMLDLNLKGSRTDAVAGALAIRGVPYFIATGYAEAQPCGGHVGLHVLRKPFSRATLEDSFRRMLTPIEPV